MSGVRDKLIVAPSPHIHAEKNRMRVAYARSQSFGLDAKVFWETLLCVLKKNLNREPSVRRKMPARQGGNR